ncbi:MULTISPECIES: hypothetical protein [Frankia]|uniref:PPM-type phosphatase domain-containing protein n=1 Tax=Frankia alni (strain DSM 45986 / CECT 9034 / ACN14a) TaxID=326424 RepID=Q0RBS6_FRAAA|nr:MULTISPECIES: hypothetical protein [Frankia]CAJ65108.1 hypothetical protein FRAAL6485 [Frankia alni ACN14a]
MTAGESAVPRPEGPLRTSAGILRLPKNAIDPIEDGAAASERTGRFAVADGASAGRDVHLWARALVHAYIRRPPPVQPTGTELRDWFHAVAQQWSATAPEAVGPSWLDDGPGAVTTAYATFLGLQLVRRPDGRTGWDAVAVGDCCLVRLGADAEITTFPLTGPEQFTDTPHLVPGSPAMIDGALRTGLRYLAGPLTAGDTLFLATDAVARWLLTLARDDPAGLRQVARTPRDELRAHLATQRGSGAVEKDDLTLLTLRVRAAPAGPSPA